MGKRLDTALCAVMCCSCAPTNAATPYPSTEPPAGADASSPSEPSETLEPIGVARYFDREIDLAPFLAGFPYQDFEPDLEHAHVVYVDKSAAYRLRRLKLDGAKTPWDLGAGEVISDVDWSTRSLWDVHWNPPTERLWLHADASNDERMNVWTLDPATKKLEQLTNHDYVYAMGFSEDESTLAYLPRRGTKAPFSTCLRLRDVKSGKEREIVCDSPELSFTWSALRFSPDAHALFFAAQTEGDRNRVQIVRVDLQAADPVVEVLTDPKRRRNTPTLLEGWLADDRLLFLSNEDGYGNVWSLSRTTGKIEQLTRYREDVTSARLVGNELIAVHRTPAGSTLVRLDAQTGAELAAERLPGGADVSDAHGTTALVTHQSPDIVHEQLLVDLARPGLGQARVVGLSEPLAEQIVACKASAVTFATFDRDKKTRAPRMLHAFLLEPTNPIADPAQRLALITAFYGGDNRYSVLDHVLCAAGLTVLSPAVRGSSGFGREFSSLNDKDLGGDEIVDLIHAARWLSERTGLPPSRIGVYGGSHGGYATMRALTFPPDTNGRKESFAFGFGMAHAGFSDIVSFYEATNIPDWVVLESGDPTKPKDLAKMRDRSPISHVQRLSAPLLLTHGSEDWRVPVTESRRFAERAQAEQRPVQYVEFDGQGHHIEGLPLQVQLYQVRFDFLRAVAEGVTEAEKANAK